MGRFVILAVLGTGCASSVCTTCPTAELTANGLAELSLSATDMVTYTWDSTNADVAASAVGIAPQSPDGCGNTDGPWVVQTLQGMRAPEPVLPCQAGFTYTLTFTVTQTATGDGATAAITITVH